MNQPTLKKHIDKFNLNIYFLLSKVNIQEPLGLVRKILRWLALVPLASILITEPLLAQQIQPVIPASDGTGTIVAPNGNQINITGGQLSRDNANLFHSFTQFGLNADQIANFLSTPGIQNILGRIVGGNPSVINGQIQVTGSNANLFLMNPAGIVFGANVSLNVPGAFTATTANGIGFGSNWFNASGTNNYADLVGNPGTFSFSMSEPGAIFNAGNLTVGEGQNLTLLAGTVANTGSVSAPEGQIIVSAVPGEKLVRLSQPGSPLSLEIQPLPQSGNQPQAWSLPILSLPQLLTSGGGANASKLTLNSDGKLTLSGSGIAVENGDIVAGNVTAKTATLSANRNLLGVESQLQTTENLNLLAGNTIQIRDSVTNPFVAKSGGNLFIQGNQGIDILALNHPKPAFESGGNLSLVSDSIISGDSHFTSGGNFSILNLSGQPGTFTSLYDPIITVAGDYGSSSYTGAALKVQAGGSIIFSGGIRITGSDTTIDGSPAPGTDDFLLQNFPALILRSQSGNINVNGNIDTSVASYGGGPVILSATGNINARNINTSSTVGNGGNISINTTGGGITVGNLTSTGTGTGGTVTLDAARDISTNVINTGFTPSSNKADVSITSRNGSINVNGSENDDSILGKSITINALGTVNISGLLNARSDGSQNAGNVIIGDTLVPNSITVGRISTRNLAGNGGNGGNISVTTTGSFNATKAFSRSTGQVVNPTELGSVSITSEATSGRSGAININANGGISTVAGISTTSSSGTGGNITLTSNNGTINTNRGDISSNGSSSGNITLNSASNITARNITTSGTSSNNAGNVNIQSSNGNITTGVINASGRNSRTLAGYGGGIVTLNTTGDVTTDDIITSGGSLGNAGNIDARGRNIQIGNIDARAINNFNSSRPGVDGSVNLQAIGSITTGNINTSYDGGASGGSRGGAATLNAGTTIKTGAIDTSSNNTSFLNNASVGTVTQPAATSNGGNVSLTAGNIEFASINTQGIGSRRDTFANQNRGVGGNVSITANGVPNGTVRGTGTIPTPQVSAPPITTILSSGNLQSGTVNVTHNGGEDNVPFTVGNSTTNGVAGAIDAGASSRITSGSSFPVLPNGGNATGTPNGITIASVNSPPTLSANQSLNNVQQDKPLTFTYADLNPSVNDTNGDRTSLQIDSITAGTLRKNGVAVVPGTPSAILSPGDSLEYTPPPGFSGDISPFSISVGDGVSFSAPRTIGFNVAATPTPTPELPPKEQTDDLLRTERPVTTLPTPNINPAQPPKFDSVVENIDDKFARQFESYLGVGLNNDLRERRRVSLYETQDILRKIEERTGVKPAIIYVTFTPSGVDEKVLGIQQGSDQLDLVVVTTKGEPIRKRISTAKRKDVLIAAEDLSNILQNPDNDTYLQRSQELYQLIVAPLKEELDKKGINNLLFIADQGLRSLPFAALHDGKQFLVENYSVGFTPALSITDTRYVDIRNSQVLAMGASKFQQLPSLPAVPEELSIVAKEIWQGKFFLNQNFTLNNLKSIRSSRPFGIIHLATHGEFGKGTLDNSFIQFWDSKLKLSQLGDLGLNNPTVELLVLSACETALGDREAELGFGGFAYKAGVKTAIASLWQVSDSGTLGLMTELYKNLKTAPIKAEALRQAQIAMIKGQVGIDNGVLRTTVRGVTIPKESPEATQKKDLKHPYYWAAFTMIGSPW
ncbi:MAG: CHAT domain-containing protein [Cyanomargarita calcarea GSE-NOS-MK-12-04C]|jgi:filamentous hemagglutinin family protein|uniref:CHAT domain-containing protein n=1 Tax=Cyanomargarita calcarea GSE-NOS-MK-12-04C TaxID=2839659 RepID=A0A951QSI6_9CYAN|nr:CHAT domain-containing protein [Cyanomargarita calcarea GSE-NOS-MK-12-04C]